MSCSTRCCCAAYAAPLLLIVWWNSVISVTFGSSQPPPAPDGSSCRELSPWYSSPPSECSNESPTKYQTCAMSSAWPFHTKCDYIKKKTVLAEAYQSSASADHLPSAPTDLKVGYFFYISSPADYCNKTGLSISWKAPQDGTQKWLVGFLLQITHTEIDQTFVSYRTFNLSSTPQNSPYIQFHYNCEEKVRPLAHYHVQIFSLPRSANDTNSVNTSISPSHTFSCPRRTFCWTSLVSVKVFPENSSTMIKFLFAPASFQFQVYKVLMEYGIDDNVHSPTVCHKIVNFTNDSIASVVCSGLKPGRYKVKVGVNSSGKDYICYNENVWLKYCVNFVSEVIMPENNSSTTEMGRTTTTLTSLLLNDDDDSDGKSAEKVVDGLLPSLAASIIVVFVVVIAVVCYVHQRRHGLKPKFGSATTGTDIFVQRSLLLLDSGDSGPTHNQRVDLLFELLERRCQCVVIPFSTYVNMRQETSSIWTGCDVDSFAAVIVVHTAAARRRFDAWTNQQGRHSCDVFCQVLENLRSKSSAVYHVCFRCSPMSVDDDVIRISRILRQTDTVYELLADVEQLLSRIQTDCFSTSPPEGSTALDDTNELNLEDNIRQLLLLLQLNEPKSLLHQSAQQRRQQLDSGYDESMPRSDIFHQFYEAGLNSTKGTGESQGCIPSHSESLSSRNMLAIFAEFNYEYDNDTWSWSGIE